MTKTAAWILAGALLTPIPALAQGQADFDEGHEGHKGMHRAHGEHHGAEGRGADRHLERLSRALDLTEDQKAAVKEVLAGNPEARRADRQAMKEARETLKSAIHADVFDESAVRDAAAAVAAQEADIAVNRASTFQELRAILTPEQLESFQQLHESGMERGERGERGKRGPQGRRGGRGGMNRF